MAKALECEQLNNGDPLSQHFPRMSLHTLHTISFLLLLLPWILKCICSKYHLSSLLFFSFRLIFLFLYIWVRRGLPLASDRRHKTSRRAIDIATPAKHLTCVEY